MDAAGEVDGEWTRVTVSEPRIPADHHDGKEVVLDVKITTAAGTAIDVEIQMFAHTGIRERMAYYAARLLTAQLDHGQPYHRLRPAITLVITGFDMISVDTDYRHCYLLHDPDHHDTFTDALQVHTLELSKVPPASDGTSVWPWLRFIAATTSEELRMAATHDPDIAEAAMIVERYNAEEAARHLLEAREKFLWDQWYIEQDARDARKQGIAQGLEQGREEGDRSRAVSAARNALGLGLGVEQVATITGLDPVEIARLTRQP